MTSHNVIILNKSVFDKDKYKIKNDGNNHYCNIFLDKGFKFQPNVCNGYHDFLMMSVNLTNVASAGYCY